MKTFTKKGCKLLVVAMVTTLIMSMTGCGNNADNFKNITTEQFWIGMLDHGYSRSYDMTDEYYELHADEDLSYIDNLAYYFDGYREFLYIDTISKDEAANMYNTYVNDFKAVCSKPTAGKAHGASKWFGAIDESNSAVIFYQWDDRFVVSTAGSADSLESLATTIEYVFTLDYTDKQPVAKPDKSIEVTGTSPDNSVIISEVSDTGDAFMLNLEDGKYISMAPIAGFNVTNDNNEKISVKLDLYDIVGVYTDSHIKVSDIDALYKAFEDVGINQDEIQSRPIDQNPDHIMYYASTTTDDTTSIYVYENVGYSTFVFIDITDNEPVQTDENSNGYSVETVANTFLVTVSE